MKIIKYANRKLYVTGPQGKYTTIKGIGELVRHNINFTVIDNVTKNDVTNDILRQVLVNCVDLPRQTMLDLIKVKGRLYESQQPNNGGGAV